MKFLAVFLVLSGAVFWGAATAAAGSPAAVEAAPKVVRAADVRVVAELKAKDTAKIDVITAGEEQKSSFGQCSAAANVVLCRILVSAVNVAAIIGTNIPVK